MNNAVSNILRFLLVLLAQIFVFRHTHLFGCVSINIFLLALLMLPFEVPRWIQYLIAFATGFLIDIFNVTYGINASACTLIMFVRPYLVVALNGRKTDDIVDKPLPGVKDFRWLLAYTVILVFIQQFAAIIIETFTFQHFWKTLLVILGNTILTSTVILCCEYLFVPVKKRN